MRYDTRKCYVVFCYCTAVCANRRFRCTRTAVAVYGCKTTTTMLPCIGRALVSKTIFALALYVATCKCAYTCATCATRDARAYCRGVQDDGFACVHRFPYRHNRTLAEPSRVRSYSTGSNGETEPRGCAQDDLHHKTTRYASIVIYTRACCACTSHVAGPQ